MKRKLLFAAMVAVLGSLNINAQLTDGTVYWIQDVATGQFISQGANWGTQATVQDVGGMGFQAVYVSEGVYKFKNIMWNKVNNADLGFRVTDGYCDQAASDVTLTASGTGYLVGIAGGNYLCNNQSENSYGVKPIGLSTNSTDAAVWRFLTKSEYDAAIQAYKDAKAASYATSLGYSAANVAALETLINDANQFISKDYTSSITNAALNTGSTNGWTATKPNQRAQAFGSENGTMAEAWNGCVVATQTVSNLPNGLYKVSFVGTFRPNGSGNAKKLTSAQTSSPAYVSANDSKEEFIHWIDVAAQADNRTAVKNNAADYTSTFYTYVTDGTLNLGVKQDTWYNGNMWCPFGYFTLTYYTDQVSDDDATAIINTANGIKDNKMGSGVKSALTSAISTFDGSRTIANYNLLNDAITNANASIASYAALQTAITNANNHTIYNPVFATSTYATAVSTAQGVYDAATVADCTDAITALTDGIHGAYEGDYSAFVDDYAYDYSTLLSQDLTEWKSTDFAVMTANEHWNGKTGQRYYEQTSAEWGQNSWSHEAYETAVLPAGHYVMSITARASAAVTSSMSVKVGDNEAIVVSLPNKGANGRGVTTAGVGSFADGTYANGNNGFGWEYRFISFTVEEESPVTFRFDASTNASYNWVSIAAPLLKGDVHPNQIKLNQAKALATTLAGYESQISAATYATFAADITAANNATVESTNLDEIITNLQNDIATARAEAEAFARGAAMNALVSGDNSVVLTDEATATNWTPTPERNTWSVEADESGMATPFVQNWLAKGNTLADNSISYVPIRGLNNGYYEISALVRIYSESGDEPAATSATFTVNGNSVNLLDGTSFIYNEMKGVYKTVSIRVQAEDALNIGLAYSGANFNWISWKNLTVTYLCNTPADATDYTALANAISAAEAKTIGFEAGEYAPYNNIAALEALAAAKAIDPEAVNSQSSVQTATATLTGATWTENAEELNAIYDGTFAAATNDGAPTGWQMSNNTLGGSYHARAFVLTSGMTNYDNLEAFGQGDDTRSAFYIRFDGTNSDQGSWYNYGKTDGYKMPLKASTKYYITLQAGAWGDYANKDLSVTIKDASSTNVVATTLKTTKKTSSGQGVDELTYVFETNEAGDYTLSFWNQNVSNYAAIVSNIELKKATPATMAISDAQYATFVAPFDVEIPSGVTAYTVTGRSGNTLVMDEVATTISANTPVILFKETALDATAFYGRPVDGTPEAGLLTGVYAETLAPVGSYVLQNNDSKVGFYKVNTYQPTVGTNRCYLTVPAGVKANAFFFNDATGIQNVLEGMQAGEIYDISGRKLGKLQKGVNIVNGKKVLVK